MKRGIKLLLLADSLATMRLGMLGPIYALTTVGCIGYLFVTGEASLLLVQVVLGIAVALLSPAYDSVYSHYVAREKEASDRGSWEAMGYTVSAVAALVGGYVAHAFGFVWLFVSMATFSALATVASFGLLAPEETLARD